jgi:hypothetical protein
MKTNYIPDILRAMLAQYWQTFPKTPDDAIAYHLLELSRLLGANPRERLEVLETIEFLHPQCDMARHCKHQWRCDGPLPGELPGDCFETKSDRGDGGVQFPHQISK